METSQRPSGAEQDAVGRRNRSRPASCRPVGLSPAAFGRGVGVLADGFRRPGCQSLSVGGCPAAYFCFRLCRVGKVKGGGLNRPQLSVPRFHFAPHRTERTDFPYSALRTHSSGGLPLCRGRQFIEFIAGVQLLVGIMLPQAVPTRVFAPEPTPQPVAAVVAPPPHHGRAVAIVEIAGPAAQYSVGFAHHR